MSDTPLNEKAIEKLFTRESGDYHFARWGRPIAPVAFGIDDDSLAVMKRAMATTVGITGSTLAETDPELGANFMIFFCRDWDEVGEVPNLDKLIPNLPDLLQALKQSGANQYRSFAFDKDGAIQMCIVLLRMDKLLAQMPIQTLTTSQTMQSLLLWSETAFEEDTPIAVIESSGLCIVKPAYAAVIRAAYDPVLPGQSKDTSHALRLHARAAKLLSDMAE